MDILKLGSTGPDLAILQDALRLKGFSPGPTNATFGLSTQAAVIAFQRSEGLCLTALSVRVPPRPWRCRIRRTSPALSRV